MTRIRLDAATIDRHSHEGQRLEHEIGHAYIAAQEAGTLEVIRKPGLPGPRSAAEYASVLEKLGPNQVLVGYKFPFEGKTFYAIEVSTGEMQSLSFYTDQDEKITSVLVEDRTA